MHLDTKPFSVPNFIIVDSIDGLPSVPLSALSADELSAKCDEFRAAVFKKAGKEDPRRPESDSAHLKP